MEHTPTAPYRTVDALIAGFIAPVINAAPDRDILNYDLRGIAEQGFRYSERQNAYTPDAAINNDFELFWTVVDGHDWSEVMLDHAADIAEDINEAGVAAADVLRAGQRALDTDTLTTAMLNPLKQLATHYLTKPLS